MELLCIFAALAVLFLFCAFLTLKCNLHAALAPLSALGIAVAWLTAAGMANLLLPGTLRLTDEDELSPVLREAALIIADPLYQPICPAGAAFLSLPHIAFSGRLYEKTIPNLIKEEAFTDFVQKVQKNLGKLPQNRV